MEIEARVGVCQSSRQWRVAITEIERRTGLDFGNVVRDADTIKEHDQLHVGKVRIIVKSMSDLLPKSAER
ncbi:hypothetical protein [uncultured Bradyrhizobium sp.]|uniref:hypothetical protein n=1 Tax=uncultured Bradyrhizobium sp. TaxID=199684 RepID=UPI0035CA7A32